MGEQMSEIWTQMLDLGGWTMVVLALLSVLAVATALYAAVQLFTLRVFSNNKGAARHLTTFIMGLRGASDTEIQEQIDLEARGLLRQAQSGFRILELIITAAPLLGLLGTVLGMIDAFQAMQMAGEAVKPADLAGGIWEALITTAAGMVVALIALGIHTVLEAIVDQFKYRLEKVATNAASALSGSTA